MNERTIMKNFLHYIRKEHKYHLKWLLFWVCGIIVLILHGESTAINTIKGYCILSGIFLVLATNIYLRKYTEFRSSNRGEKTEDKHRKRVHDSMSDIQFRMHDTLTDIIGTHGFDTGVYYSLLLERLLVIQGVSIAAVFAAAAFKLIVMNNALAFSGLILVLPIAVWYWNMLITDYFRTHKKGAVYTVFMGLWYFIETIVAIIVLAYAFISFVLLVSGIVQSRIMLSGVTAQAVIKCGCDDLTMVWIIILTVILVIFFADVNQLVVHINWTKTTKIFVGCIVFAIAALIAFQGHYCSRDNVALSDKNISIKHDEDKKTYGFDEIDFYRIYYKDSDFKMNVTFSDGSAEDIFYSSSTNTDGWDRRYHSDYQYASELVDILLERDIKGTIETGTWINNTARDRDAEDNAYLEHIVKVLSD